MTELAKMANFTRFECRDLLPGASPTTVGYDLATGKNF
jgi:hypothetical protein